MSQTDVTEVATAVTGMTIESPDSTGDIPPHVHNPRPSFLDERAEAGEPTVSVPAEPKDALFDTEAYIDVPVMDGQATDTLKIAFAGSIEYEASDAEGQALFEELTLGKEVELRIAGVVVKKAGAWKLVGKDEAEREVVTGSVGVKVHSLWHLRPEDLG